MSDHEKRFPTHCDDIAQTILNMIKYWKMNPQKLQGVFHYQSEEELTKLEMALNMAKIFNLPYNHLIAENPPTGNESVKRPYKSELNCQKLKSLNLFHSPRPFSEGINIVLKKFDD